METPNESPLATDLSTGVERSWVCEHRRGEREGSIALVLLKVIFYFEPPFWGLWGPFSMFSRLKQNQVVFPKRQVAGCRRPPPFPQELSRADDPDVGERRTSVEAIGAFFFFGGGLFLYVGYLFFLFEPYFICLFIVWYSCCVVSLVKHTSLQMPVCKCRFFKTTLPDLWRQRGNFARRTRGFSPGHELLCGRCTRTERAWLWVWLKPTLFEVSKPKSVESVGSTVLLCMYPTNRS